MMNEDVPSAAFRPPGNVVTGSNFRGRNFQSTEDNQGAETSAPVTIFPVTGGLPLWTQARQKGTKFSQLCLQQQHRTNAVL